MILVSRKIFNEISTLIKPIVVYLKKNKEKEKKINN